MEYNYKDIVYNNKTYRIFSPGKIYRPSLLKIMDQLDPNHKCYLGGDTFLKHIKDTYNFTEKQYYNLVVFLDPDYKVLCEHCHRNEISFENLSHGYRGLKYCSYSCANKAIKCGAPVDYDISFLKLSSSEILDIGSSKKYTILSFGEIVKLNKTLILDQLSGKVIKGHGVGFSLYLTRTYNISLEEYYNLIVYGDSKRKHYNSKGNLLNFQSLYKPYGRKRCKNSEEIQKLIDKHNLDISLEKERKLIEKANNSRKTKLEQEERQKRRMKNISPTKYFFESDCRQKLNTYITKMSKKYKKAKLYIAWIPGNWDYFKIGITVQDLDTRKNSFKNLRYFSIHLLLESDLDKIATLEYNIKLTFNKYSANFSNEAFELKVLREILKYIKSNN